MNKVLTVLDLHKSCRTCLKELDEKKHDVVKLPKEVFQIFKQITGFRKNEKLLYPKFICDTCYEQIKGFNDLKDKTSENQLILVDLVDSYIEKFVKDSAMGTQAEVEKEISQPSEEIQAISNENNMEVLEENEASDISQNEHFQNFLQIEIKEEINDIDTYNSSLPNNLSTNFQETNVNILSNNNNMENDLDIHNSNIPDTLPLQNSQKTKTRNIENDVNINNSIASDSVPLTNSQKTNVNISSKSNSIENEDNICKVCSSTYSTAALLETHMKTHKEVQPFPCKLCENGFDKKSLYNRHMKECHAKTPKYYSAALDSERRLTRSKAAEADSTNKQNIPANDINKKTETVKNHDKSNDDDDISDKSVANKISCKFCQKIYSTASALRMHMRQHKEKDLFECTKCEQRFKSKYRLKKHDGEIHSDESLATGTNPYYLHHMLPQRSSKPEKNSLTCLDCGDVFLTIAKLREHSFSHRPVEDRPYKCEQCAKTFVLKRSYDDHLLRHAGIKHFQCPHCSIRKVTKSDLRTHIRSHLNNGIFPCTVCAKIFNRVENLRVHQRLVHEGIKRFKCPHCEKAFGKPDNLKYHIMVHTGERPHICPTCDRGFIQAATLRNHMKTHAKKIARAKH